MKKYKLFAAVVASVTLTTGCYDLDVYPEGELSSGTFFKTQDHADQAMMGVYNMLPEEHVFGRQYGFDCLGGIGCGYDAPSYKTIANGTYTTTNGDVSNKFKYLYEGIARANIVLQNVDNCDMTDELKLRYKAEAKFMRALYYFTLMDFWGGVPIYDETTIVEDEFLDMLKGKSSFEDVRKFVIADLDEAIKYLPVTWDDANKGRATSGAALALKGKVLLYSATLPIVDGVKTGDAKYYDEAKACFEEVMGLTPDSKYAGVYALHDGGTKAEDYAELFTPTAENCSEMIFSVQNIGGVGQNFGMPLAIYLGTRSTFGSGWNNVMASTDFVDSYEWEDGTPFKWTESKTIGGYTWAGYPDYDVVTPEVTEENPLADDGETDPNKKYTKRKNVYLERERVFFSYFKIKDDDGDGKNKSYDITQIDRYTPEKQNLLDMYEHRDPRMAVSIILPYTMYKGWYANAPKDCEFATGPSMGSFNESNGFIRLNDNNFKYPWRKFVPEYDMNGEITDRYDTPINFPLIRLADVKLMYAECLLFGSTHDIQGAIKQINEVRARVEMPTVSASTVDEAFKKLRHERQVELACEGHSFSDMKRWGLLEETLNGKPVETITGNVEFTRVVTSRDYLWPFPQSEIDKNPELKKGQNPGW